ncbi:hypothetical protein D3C87_1681500 [compost metagenome]
MIHLIAINEENDVGVLLQSAGLAQVRHDGAFVRPLFQAAVELGQGEHRDVELPRHQFQLATHVADVLRAITLPTGPLHQLQVVQHQ